MDDSPWKQVTDALGGGPGRGPGQGKGQGLGLGGTPPPWLRDLVRGLGGPEVGGRPQRARRGDVRTAVLDVLATEPLNGYQVIVRIAERTDGAWRPSPGSVYPTIQQLEDDGLVTGREVDGRRVLDLTAGGRRWLDEHPDQVARTWAAVAEPEEDAAPAPDRGDLGPVVAQLLGSVAQLSFSGTRQQQAEAAEILRDARSRLQEIVD